MSHRIVWLLRSWVYIQNKFSIPSLCCNRTPAAETSERRCGELYENKHLDWTFFILSTHTQLCIPLCQFDLKLCDVTWEQPSGFLISHATSPNDRNCRTWKRCFNRFSSWINFVWCWNWLCSLLRWNGGRWCGRARVHSWNKKRPEWYCGLWVFQSQTTCKSMRQILL